MVSVIKRYFPSVVTLLETKMGKKHDVDVHEAQIYLALSYVVAKTCWGKAKL